MQNDPYSSNPQNGGYAPQPQGIGQPSFGGGYNNMPQRPPVPPESFVEPPAPKKPVALIALIIAAPVLLILGLLFGAMMGNSLASARLEPQLEEAQKQASDNLLKSTTTQTVVSRGFPQNADFNLITKLGFPNTLQAVSVKSTESDPGMTGVLTLDTKDEMGRWIVGNPAQEVGKVGEIHMLAIQEKWQATPWQDLTKVPVAGELVNVSTPAEKLAFIEKMRVDAANCPQDSLVKVEFMQICTKITTPRQEDGSYRPHMNLFGFGAVRGMSMAILGSYLMLDGNTYSAAQQKSFQESDTLPDYVKNLNSVYLKSLSETTFATVAN